MTTQNNTQISIDTPDGTVLVSATSLRDFNHQAKEYLQQIAGAQESLKALCEAFSNASGMKPASAKAWATARFKEDTKITVVKGVLFERLDNLLEGL